MPLIEIGSVDGVAIRGGAMAFPSLRLDNEEALMRIGARLTPEHRRRIADQLGSTLGVARRAWAHVPGTPLDPEREESTEGLALAAARAALGDAGVSPEELSLVLCATSTPTTAAATVSGVVAGELGTRAACLDLRGGCAAAVFGLATAALHVQAGCGPALLVGAETLSKVVPAGHQMAALALADGAGALVIARGRGHLRAAALATDDRRSHLVQGGGADFHAAALAAGAYFLSGDPEELTGEIPSRYREALSAVLARAGMGVRDVDLYVPHQTTRALIQEVCQRASIPRERAFVNIDQHGNVGVAGFLVALVEARAAGRLHPGARVAIAAVGGGMSYGAAVLEC